MQAEQDEAAAQAEADRTKPYEEQEYRAFPVVGSRVAVWVLAQLHLLFAAFVLAVPMFALIIEFIGYLNGDKRYDEPGPRVHQAAVGLVLPDRDLRGLPRCSCWSCSTRSS